MKRLALIAAAFLALLPVASSARAQSSSSTESPTADSGRIVGQVSMASATRAHSLSYDFPGLSSYELPGAEVFIKGPGVDTRAVTDNFGRFLARGPFQAADYSLEFRTPGFATMRRTVTAVPMGVASVSLQIRFCDMADARQHNEPYLIDWVRGADAIVHFRIDAAEPPRPAQEAGEGCQKLADLFPERCFRSRMDDSPGDGRAASSPMECLSATQSPRSL